MRFASTKILETSGVQRSAHGPFAILVLLPSHIIKGWRCILGSWKHNKYNAPRLEFGVPREPVLVHAGFTDHNLEHPDHVVDDCSGAGVSLWDLFRRLEEGHVESLVEFWRKVARISLCPSILVKHVVADGG